MKKYSNYKTTDISWLKEIPEHWKELDTKRCFHFPKLVVGKDFPNHKVLSLSVNGVIFRDMESRMGKHHSDMGTYQIIEPDSIVLCLFDMDVTPRIVGHSDKTGIITSAYTNIKPRANVSSKYYYYYYLLQDYNNYLFSQGTGIRTTLTRAQFGALKIALPPLPEQTAIANFLDYKLEKINRFITKKKQLIELLIEQKAAIVNQAVTKGINPNAKLKPSGIEWLGDIPEHWESSKIKYLANIYNGSTPKSSNSDFWNGEINWVTPEDMGKVSNGRISDTKRKITVAGLESCGTTLLPSNSVILTTRAPIGNIAISEVEMCTNQGCKSLVPKSFVSSKYLMLYLIAKKSTLDSLGRGTTFMELSTTSLKNLTIVNSKDEKELQNIEKHIELETTKIDKTISTIEKEITLVEEYKTALIAEAVTGKIDVRDFKVPNIEEPLEMVAEEASNYNKPD